MPEIFNNWFVFSSDTHRYEASCSEKGMLKVKSFNTKSHGKEAIIYRATHSWNSLQKKLEHFLLHNLTKFFETSLSENLLTLTNSCFMLI